MTENNKEASQNTEREKAANALRYIMPILEKYQLRWCISGGLACYLYGVDRPIEAIDIDVEIDKDDPKFQGLVADVAPNTELPFQLWIDENFDNWVMDVVYDDQLLSICDTPHLKMFNKETGRYELFYPDGKIPDPVMVDFEGLQIPLAPRRSILSMKKALANKKDRDNFDIIGMESMIEENLGDS